MGLASFNRARRIAAIRSGTANKVPLGEDFKLEDMTLAQLRLQAKKQGLTGYGKLTKVELIQVIRGEGGGQSEGDDSDQGEGDNNLEDNDLDADSRGQDDSDDA